MDETFKLHASEIQPSQLYISEAKLNVVLKTISRDFQALEPIPIKELDGELVSTDGHTRAVALLLNGIDELEVIWEDEDLDWEEYGICVKWCKDEGILSIHDLKHRIVNHREYEELWYERCRLMQDDLKKKDTSH
ncbi:MAG: hypothetical protein ACW98U_02745 [Candidatus Thorarchaeota archaeon]|jgi:hypothetical protein